ncbi:hypothetical protein [Methylovulum psychrotolerans]|jgi:hypothetical protein|uniref:Uncharacterized protein n=1 Tax=Methylovulum psychrotolerans TaxID=1704499 RepID=A0A2S5CFR0_9GAMM|nr:hypothetical protein [Methylovulum psychrotolerans]MBT9100032.1 hypothetical protein [Methylovulum psychrotolerans]POZ49641.1 hypothetical protein AADEFJLK_04588 [Methylovulum psychrotolerans]
MTYSLEQHVCRYCLGRILSAPLAAGVREFKCANCGHSESGSEVKVLCVCGLSIKGKFLYQCVQNDQKSPVNNAEYVAGLAVG